MPATATHLEAALALLDLGWSPFPLCWPHDGQCACGRGHEGDQVGKTPLVKWKGLQDQLPTVSKVRAWWRKNPRANIGIATGALSGLVVLDVDGPEGERSLDTLNLPPTIEVATGRGRHLYFRHPGGRVKNSASEVAPGLDIRGDGGFVIAPPSVHRSGDFYAWTTAPEMAMAMLPDCLTVEQPPAPVPIPTTSGRQDGNAYARTALQGEANEVARTPEGARNDRLNTAAFRVGQLLHLGLSEDLATEALVAAAISVGLLEGEARKTIASGLHGGQRRPRQPDHQPDHQPIDQLTRQAVVRVRGKHDTEARQALYLEAVDLARQIHRNGTDPTFALEIVKQELLDHVKVIPQGQIRSTVAAAFRAAKPKPKRQGLSGTMTGAFGTDPIKAGKPVRPAFQIIWDWLLDDIDDVDGPHLVWRKDAGAYSERHGTMVTLPGVRAGYAPDIMHHLLGHAEELAPARGRCNGRDRERSILACWRNWAQAAFQAVLWSLPDKASDEEAITTEEECSIKTAVWRALTARISLSRDEGSPLNTTILQQAMDNMSPQWMQVGDYRVFVREPMRVAICREILDLAGPELRAVSSKLIVRRFRNEEIAAPVAIKVEGKTIKAYEIDGKWIREESEVQDREPGEDDGPDQDG